MPPERHSSPPPRPPRDRHPGPGFGGGPRRSFGGGGFGGGGPREGGPRPPFTPRPAQPASEPPQSVRLREGDREVEVHGSPPFVRQILEDLPALFARLRGEAAPLSRPASISMPPPPRAEAAPPAGEEDLDGDDDEEEGEPPAPASHRAQRHPEKAARTDRKAAAAPALAARARANGKAPATGRSNGKLSLEDRVFNALEDADHPLSVAAIRKQIGGETTGQQIRRILERAADRVIATDERPAAYALR